MTIIVARAGTRIADGLAIGPGMIVALPAAVSIAAKAGVQIADGYAVGRSIGVTLTVATGDLYGPDQEYGYEDGYEGGY